MNEVPLYLLLYCSKWLQNLPRRAYPQTVLEDLTAIGAIGALMNRVLQPRPLAVLGLNVWMGTAAGADELVQQFLGNGSNICRGGPIPRRSSQGLTVGLWEYTLLDTSSPVPEMYSLCQTDQSS